MGIGKTIAGAVDNTTYGRGFMKKDPYTYTGMMSTLTMERRLQKHLNFTNTKHGGRGAAP